LDRKGETVKRIAACAVLGIALLSACNEKKEAAPATAQPPTSTAAKPGAITSVFCVDPKTTKPCGVMPHDVVPGSFGYNTARMIPSVQVKFDNFSWQSFIALNWPANDDGTPNLSASLTSDQSVTRVWDLYKDADEVFLAGGATPDGSYPSKTAPPIPAICKQSALNGGSRPRFVKQFAKIDPVSNIPDSDVEASVNVPLIDSNGNFVVYSVAMNRDEFQYIYDNQFYNASKQTTAASFPPGVTNGVEGAIELKSSWRILTDAEVTAGSYITRSMQIYVSAAQSASGAEFCTPPITFGLIGLHIVHKTSTETDWVWSTFEHVNNAPLSSTPLPATATAGSGGCAPPVSTATPKMSLYNPACTTDGKTPCPVNQPPVQPNQAFVWQTSQPYAKSYLYNKQYGTQVVRCSSIYPETIGVNTAWQAAVPAPYSNYILVGSQWFDSGEPTPPSGGASPNQQATGTGPNPLFPAGSIAAPPLLANTTAETYLQNGTTFSSNVASCLGCHTFARGTQQQLSDFSFILDRAQGGTAQQQAALKQRVAEVDKALAARKQ
jgi:hypothetical protein